MISKEADVEEIALHEDWAKGLVYCDIEGVAITEDGYLILCDECGKFAYCPDGRFEIQFDAPNGEWEHIGGDEWCCSKCGRVVTTEGSWEHPLSIGEYHCPNCGVSMRKEEENEV